MHVGLTLSKQRRKCQSDAEERVQPMKKKSVWKKILIVLLCLAVLGAATVFGINAYVRNYAADRVITPEEAAALEDVDCIMVLGCQVKPDGTPSDMLRDRLERGVSLYFDSAAPKLLVSGDHGQEVYNEVAAMKTYALEAGVPAEDVFMDHAGFCTYDSVYRAKEIFQADKILIVTQEYHLYRALYIAEKLGVEAYGVASDYHSYAGQTLRDVREIVARCKDFAAVILKIEPKFLGEAIPVSGDGNVTND